MAEKLEREKGVANIIISERQKGHKKIVIFYWLTYVGSTARYVKS